jgi:hypothetical protein
MTKNLISKTPCGAQARDKMRHPTRAREKLGKDITGAGVSAEARILRVMADPTLVNASISQKIRISGVSRATWYRHRNDPLFRARLGKVASEALEEYLGPVFQALIDSALVVGRKGHRDRKLYLEVVGEYDPKGRSARGRAEEEAERNRRSRDIMSDQELLEAFRDVPERPT